MPDYMLISVIDGQIILYNSRSDNAHNEDAENEISFMLNIQQRVLGYYDLHLLIQKKY
jgi:hypothetical protein